MGRKFNLNPRTRALITIGLVITIMTLAFLFIFVRQQKQTFSNIVQYEQNSLQRQMDLLIDQTASHYKSRIKSLATNRIEAMNAFIQKDRKKLLEETAPLFKLFEKENPYFKGFFFANPDNTIFLRVGKPELHSDDVTTLSPIISEANRRKEIMTGFEIAKIGLAFRITYPVFKGETYTGLYGFVINADFFLNQLNLLNDAFTHEGKESKTEIALVFPMTELQKAVFLNKPYETIGKYIVFSDKDSPFQELPDHVNLEKQVQIIKIHGQSHAMIQAGTFKDHAGIVIAMAFSLMDIEGMVSKDRRTIILTVLFSMMLLLFSLVIIYFDFNILFKKITQLNDSLIKSNTELEFRVEERTADLQKEIKERKKAEKAILDSHEQFLTVLDSIDATIFVADMKTHKILFMNKYMIDSFDRDMTGEICWKSFRGESKPCACCTNDKLIDEKSYPTGLIVWQDQNPITGKKYINHDRAIEWTDGSLVRLQIATDITNLLDMQESLQQAQKMESIGSLAGGIAHDFNNILFPIIGMSELMMDDLPPGSLEWEYAQGINKAGLRAKELVSQILAFSRKSEQVVMPVRFQKVLKEVLKLCRSTIPSNIVLESSIKQDCGSVMGNATQLHQIGMNLITNSYHAVQNKNGRIVVTLEEISLKSVGKNSEAYALFTVSDDGMGMTTEVKKKIFDPYFTTKGQGRGTGLGLAVVYGIVEEYGGRIEVESEIGSGTTFKIYLPIIIETENDNTAEIKTEFSTGCEHILLVDDEDEIVRLERQMLERLGYIVTARISSIEALEAFKENPDKFDMVVSDMSMPAMTGDQLAYEIKKIRPGMPIVICTGFSERINKDKAEDIGVNGFLMKPIMKSDMAQMIRKVLDENKG